MFSFKNIKRISMILGIIICVITTFTFYIQLESPKHFLRAGNWRKNEQFGASEFLNKVTRKTKNGEEISRRKYLILTYMRSGSTLVSGILQQGGNLFFSMEPLWGIYRKCYRRTHDVCCRNDTCRLPSGPLEDLGTALYIVKNIFSCDFQNLPVQALESFSFFDVNSYGPVLRSRKCFRGKLENVEWCKEYLTSRCKSSSGVIVKTLRLSAETLKVLLKMVPDVKVIHLFRDPRAVLSSRKMVGDFRLDMGKNLTHYARQLCGRITKDVDVFQTYGLASIPLKYECLVRTPYLAVERIYKMLKLNFSTSTEKWIHEYMRADSQGTRAGGYGINRKNASLVSTRWRTVMGIDSVNTIDNVCQDMYRRTGYLPLPSLNTLRNNIPSYKSNEYTDLLCTSL